MSHDRPFHDPLSGFPGADPLGPLGPPPGIQPPPQTVPPQPGPPAEPSPPVTSVEPPPPPPEGSAFHGPQHQPYRQETAPGLTHDSPDVPGVPLPQPNDRRSSRRGRSVVLGIVVFALLTVGVGFGAGLSATDGDEGGSDHTGPEVLSALDFYGDGPWSMSVDGKSAEADQVGVWDHADCSDAGNFEIVAILDDAGCEYGIEGAYKRDDLGLVVYQRVFVLADGDAAHSAAARIDSAELTGLVAFHEPIPEGPDAGSADAAGHYLLVTHAVFDGDVFDESADEAVSVFGYRHADSLALLHWL